MIRCIRLWSGPDGNSHFEEGTLDLESGPRGDMLSGKFPVASVSFQETNEDPVLGWHTDPVRQLVIMLGGSLEFTTHDGRFLLRSGDILFTEDTAGGGHNWTLHGGQPWRRIYAILDQMTVVPFRSAEPQSPDPMKDGVTQN
jgi:quercetin dioxygenase-like cupin family protein